MNDIKVSIIDQQVNALASRLEARFEELSIRNDKPKLRSASFVLLVVKTMLNLSEEEAFDCMTEGGSDFGVDAIQISPIVDGEFIVTLFQGKYKENLEGKNAFPEDGVTKAIRAVGNLFDPDRELSLNKALSIRVEEIRSAIRDGAIPQARVILCNNGRRWTSQAQMLIDSSGFGNQATWDYVNHDTLISILKAPKLIDESIRLTGKAIVEEFNFRRVLLGRIALSEIKAIFDRHGELLLQRNIRRYLGLQGNRVNERIAETLKSSDDKSNFYFYNNGITMVCSQFQHTGLQSENWQVNIKGLQVINGGQTCKTIQKVLAETGTDISSHVLVRIYELPKDDESVVRNITYATNSQNPVDLRDLRSNDIRQLQLGLSIEELGFQYRRQRSESISRSTDISSATTAEAVLSVWRQKPQLAKFRSSEHFGKLYDEIFTSDLNGAQAISAVLLFRIAENKRKRAPNDASDSVRYASYFAAMLMGKSLLQDLEINLSQLDHRTFANAYKKIEEKGEDYFNSAISAIENALKALYGNQKISLQQLSATFRRGDLLPYFK